MRRLLALLGALCVIAAALLARSAFSDDDRGDGGGLGGDDGELSLLCAQELAAVCEALADDGVADVEVEPVGLTVDRLGATDADLEADAWLTLDPYPAMVDERRRFAGGVALFGELEVTGHSTGLAIVAFEDRLAALEGDCGEVTWACLADAAGDAWSDHGGETSWGRVTVGYDAPDTSGAGLLVLAQATAEHADRTDFALQDIDQRWLRDLEDEVPTRTGRSVLETLLLQGRAAFGAVGALGVDADAAAGSDRGQQLVITYPAPMFRASVVVAAPRDADGTELAASDELAEALVAAGWEAADPGEPLPSAGALDALRSAWEGVS